jgi:CelD/BcsL family acetyltransferase involved in cellulose biosynthesis
MASTDERALEWVSTIATDVDTLAPYLPEWDELAQAAGRPFCAPAWMLAWWRHGRTGDARLRVVLVCDHDGRLVGVAPFFAQVGVFQLAEYRLLAAGFSHRLGLLSRAGDQARVAAAVATSLAGADPPPASVVFEGIDAGDTWPELVAAAWPGVRARVRTDLVMEAPVIQLGGDYEAWMGRRDRKFRKEARRAGRRLDELGVLPCVEVSEAAVDSLIQLHAARWRDRGGSHVGANAHEVISVAASELGAEPGRMSIAMLRGPDGQIAAELTLRAGTTMAFWTGGFDPAWSAYAPGTQAMLTALSAAARQQVAVADLGGGAHDYKQRLADGQAPLAWRTVFPVGRRYPLIRLRLAPKHIRLWLRGAFRRLPPAVQGALRRTRTGRP